MNVPSKQELVLGELSYMDARAPERMRSENCGWWMAYHLRRLLSMGISVDATRHHLRALARAGLVDRDGPRYRINDAGRAALVETREGS